MKMNTEKYEMVLIPDKRTKKGNLYSKKELQRAIDNWKKEKYKQDYYGECALSQRRSEIDLTKVSHIVEDIYIEKNRLYCEIQFLDNKFGKLLKENIEDFYFFPRMMGTKDKKGNVTDIRILTVDSYMKWDLCDVY